MKKLLLSCGSILSLCVSSVIFAAVVEVPISVSGSTYTLGSVSVPTSGEYYYTYSGHRCYSTEQKTMVGNATILTGPSTIYCYPSP